MIEQLLREQQDLTAVERFAALHDAGTVPEAEGLYRHLIPAASPGQGQQYAFQVELDRCTGCKACVTGCHSRNGLEEGETWRFASMLRGGYEDAPVAQTVTAACHHCESPACLEGCPVLAYEKDEVTGIVRHLDDQCIGCQYCVMKCPYDVPQYSKKLGIVRKCDLCSERLAEGEAPACVQSCPNEAISVVVVDRGASGTADAGILRSRDPHPGFTRPSTVYRSQKGLPDNLRSHGEAIPDEPGHLPLVAMLVLTQASIGLLAANHLAAWSASASADWWAMLVASAAAILGAVGMGGAILHLGRPQYAFRAVLGFRRSWLSREILAFNAYLGMALLYALATVLAWTKTELPGASLLAASGPAALASGSVALLCSAMVYISTPRASWARPGTALSFLATAALVGASATLGVCGATVAAAGLVLPALVVMALSAVRLVLNFKDRGRLVRAGSRSARGFEAAKRVLFERLGRLPHFHSAFYLVGGFALPLAMLAASSAAGSSAAPWTAGLGALATLLLISGEFLDRYFFFATAPRPRSAATNPL